MFVRQAVQFPGQAPEAAKCVLGVAYGKTGLGQQQCQFGQRILLADMFVIRPVVEVTEKTVRKYSLVQGIAWHMQEQVTFPSQGLMKIPQDLLIVADVLQYIYAVDEIILFFIFQLPQVSFVYRHVAWSIRRECRQGKVHGLDFRPRTQPRHTQCVRTITAAGIEDAAKLPQWQPLALAAEMQAADVLADMHRAKAGGADESAPYDYELVFN